jgi:hypothetical protein
MSKKLSRIEERKKAIKAQLDALGEQEKKEKASIAKRGRVAEAKEARSFRKVDTRIMILGGAWLFNEFRKAAEGNQGAAQLRRLFDADFHKFVNEKDKKFVSENLGAVMAKRTSPKKVKAGKSDATVIPSPIPHSDDSERTVLTAMPSPLNEK